VIVLTLNADGWVNGLEGLRSRFPRAVKRALSRAATSAKALAAKNISADTGLASKRVKDEVKTVEKSDTQINLEVRGNRIPLIDFKARGPEPSRGRGRGVSYRLPGGRGNAPHAFIATMPSGHRGVFQRLETARTPIAQLHGPSLVHVFEKFLPDVAKRAEESLRTNLTSELRYALSQEEK
jgi:hypothetical protein